MLPGGYGDNSNSSGGGWNQGGGQQSWNQGGGGGQSWNQGQGAAASTGYGDGYSNQGEGNIIPLLIVARTNITAYEPFHSVSFFWVFLSLF